MAKTTENPEPTVTIGKGGCVEISAGVIGRRDFIQWLADALHIYNGSDPIKETPPQGYSAATGPGTVKSPHAGRSDAE